MARETIFLVQAFLPGRGMGLKADAPMRCRSAEAAIKTAEKLAPTKAGVVAYSTAGDTEFGDYDETPTIIFRAGRLPEQFDET